MPENLPAKTTPILHPGKSPIEWARAEAAALDRHAALMEASHGARTKGVALCRSRAAALRWLADAAKGAPFPDPVSPREPVAPTSSAAVAEAA